MRSDTDITRVHVDSETGVQAGNCFATAYIDSSRARGAVLTSANSPPNPVAFSAEKRETHATSWRILATAASQRDAPRFALPASLYYAGHSKRVQPSTLYLLTNRIVHSGNYC